MLRSLDKNALLAQLLTRLEQEYETLLSAQKTTQQGATHEEARPENDKDTRALEQSYLARGQAARVLELKNELDQMRALSCRRFDEETPLGLSALVKTEDDNGRIQVYLLTPAGAGEKLSQADVSIQVVTSRSPLGRSLLGSRLDDDIEVVSPTGTRTLSIIEVA